MDSLYLLIPVALLFTALAVSAFFWAVNNNQYDDLDLDSRRILFDDDSPPGEPGPVQKQAPEEHRR